MKISRIFTSLYATFDAPFFYKKIKKLRQEDETLIVLMPKFGDIVYGMLYARQFKKETGKKIAVYVCEKHAEMIKNYDCIDRIITYPNNEKYERLVYCLTILKYFFSRKNKNKDVIITAPLEKYFYGMTVKEIYRDIVFGVKQDNVELFNLKTLPLISSIENFEENKDKIVVINPNAQSNAKYGHKILQEVANMLVGNGFVVYTNVAGSHEKELENTFALRCSPQELFAICQEIKCFISIRSGIADYVATTNCIMIVLYLKNKKLRHSFSIKEFREGKIEEYFVRDKDCVENLKKLVFDKLKD